MAKIKCFKGEVIFAKQAKGRLLRGLGVWSLALLLLTLGLGTIGLPGCNYIPGCKKTPPPTVTPPAKAGVPKAGEAKTSEEAEKPKETFAYHPGSRRDPFKPLVVARAPGEKIKGDPKKSLEIGDLKLVGIVWDKRGYYYALVETPQGLGYTLKQNDQVGLNAVVGKITKDAVHFQIKTRPLAGAKGETAEVVLKLRKED